MQTEPLFNGFFFHSKNFHYDNEKVIQRNPGIKNGQSWAKSYFPKTNKGWEESKNKIKKKKDRCRDSMEAVLTNGVDFITLLNSSNPSIKTTESMKDKPIYMYVYWNLISND